MTAKVVYALDTLTESVQAFGVTGNAPYEIFYIDYTAGSKAKWIMEIIVFMFKF
ncbi:hypothetical protein MZM54_31465 [[Brevibacterium] frigoritolerans]|nr:hypothetical protein [Peribacillus frigoritolerans]